MARVKRGGTTQAPNVDVSVNAGTPDTTATGVPVDESTRGSRAVHTNPNAGASVSSSGSMDIPERVQQHPAEGTTMREGTMDGFEKPLNKPVADKPSPKVEKFVVTKGGIIVANGARTRMGEGKVIDTLNYDIKKLKQQGIKIRPATEDDVDVL